jgi:hypothetical protein
MTLKMMTLVTVKLKHNFTYENVSIVGIDT